MNSDEYHAMNWDKESSHYGVCRFCNKDFDQHENSCPQLADDDPIYQQLKEPSLWQEAP